MPNPRSPRRAGADPRLRVGLSDGRRDWFHIGERHNEVVGAAGGEQAGDERASADVYLYDTIGGWFGLTADDFIRDVASLDVDHIALHVNSPGGDVFEGTAIANVLRQHRAQVTVYVDGIAASAASLIAMAGDEIVMGIGSQLMVHDVWSGVVGNAADMRKEADVLDSLSDSAAAAYAARAGGSADEWREVMREEAWYTADEAVTAGLADRVATDADKGSATGDQVVPGSSSTSWWDMWDSLRSQDRFDLSVFAHAGRSQAPAPPMPARAGTGGPKPPTAPADGSTTTQEGGSAVELTDEQASSLRTQLGLADDADGATILAAVAAKAAAANKAPEGTVLVDAEQWRSTQAAAQRGEEARARQEDEDRRALARAAIDDGRIPKAREDHWVNLLKADPEGAAAALASLEKGVIPVGQPLGYAGDAPPAAAESVDEVRKSAAYQNWSM